MSLRGIAEKPTILLVDDNDWIRESLAIVLEHGGFDVVTTANVTDALKHIATRSYDVLLSDLHIPEPHDGLRVLGAMRHSNPEAVTILFSGYPEMKEAAKVMVFSMDGLTVTPMAFQALIETIHERLKNNKNSSREVESVAHILEHEINAAISDWLLRVEHSPAVLKVNLDIMERYAHLPQLFRDLAFRLRHPLPLGSHALLSPAAAEHGLLRRKQGYTAAMMVEESRMLQVSIFQTLQNNLHKLDFSLLLLGVMAIADEVDSQLAQSMEAYIAESKIDSLPLIA